MRKLSAHRIYPVSGPPIPYGIIEISDDGAILNIRDTGGRPSEEAGLEFYSGIIIPGMVNTHCHLELSHLKGRIPKHTGISGFVSEVSSIRGADPENILRKAGEADREMYRLGISAAGDISNTGITLAIKKHSPIQYHTFIEVFGLNPGISSVRFREALQLANGFREAGLSVSVTPHAPYSTGTDLWEHLSGLKGLTGRISIHHDESPEERELLDSRSGKMADHFRQSGFDLERLPREADNIYGLLGKYVPGSDWILVHNTLTDPGKMPENLKEEIYWALCPRSNLYIENLLPDFQRFMADDLVVCIGTDSLASNLNLSVADEMKTIQEAAPGIPFEQVLRWATLNGARALAMDKTLGSIEKGKRPGLVNIADFDWENDRLFPQSTPIRLA